MKNTRIAAQICMLLMVSSMALYTVVSLFSGTETTSDSVAQSTTPSELAPQDAVTTEEQSTVVTEEQPKIPPPEPVAHEVIYIFKIGDNFSAVLDSKGMTKSSIDLLTEAVKPHVNLGKIGVNKELIFDYFGDELRGFRFMIDEDKTLIVDTADVENYRIEQVKHDNQLVRVYLEITSSLWNAAESKGFKPAQILEIAKVFENEIDFNTDLHNGASFSIVVNALSHNGQFVRFEEMKAIKLTNGGKTYDAFYYDTKKELDRGWYDEKGVSLERIFVEPPKSASQSAFSAPFKKGDYLKHQSNLSKRPLGDGELQIGADFYQKRCKGRCKHSALDIRAAQGTPLYALGSGSVRAKTSAKSLCGYGVQLEMKDTSGHRWRALYCHMSQIKVKKGEKVKKGQIIGRSGGAKGVKGSGNSSGPHLHLELRKRTDQGKWALVDPLPHVDWQPFNTTVRYTKGHEPNKTTPEPQAPFALKGTSLKTFFAQVKSSDQVNEKYSTLLLKPQ